MDYGKLVRRAWEITKKNPILWILGLFAASGSSGGSFNMPSGGGSGSTNQFPAGGEQAFLEMSRWVQSNGALIITVGLAVFVLMILFWALGIAARGGLVSETARADAGEKGSAGRGWKTGFSKFGRTFMIQLITSLPILLVILVVVGLILIAVFGGIATFGGMESGQNPSGAVFGAIISGVLVLLGVMFFISLLSLVIAAWTNLSLASGIIEDRTFGVALRRGWQIIRQRFGNTFMVLLIDILIGLGAAIVMMIIAAILAVPAILMFVRAGGVNLDGLGWVVVALSGVALFLFTAAFGSALTTFSTALWTAYFRTVTGIDRADLAAQQGEPVVPVAPAAV